MHRKLVSLGLLTSLLGVGSIVAIVRAQEAARPASASGPSVPTFDTNDSIHASSMLAQLGGRGRSVLVDRNSSSARDKASAGRTDEGYARPILGAPVGTNPASIPESSRRRLSDTSSQAPAPVLQVERPAAQLVEPYAAPLERRDFRSADSRFGEDSSPDTTAGASAGIHLASQSPAVRVETTGPKSIKIGDNATYVITMVNDGEQSASALFVRINIPNTIDLVSHDASEGEVGVEHSGPRQELHWKLSQLSGRTHHKLTLTVRPRASTPFEVSVAWGFEPIQASASIVVQEPQLKIQLSGASEMRYGEEALYVISVSNPVTGQADNVNVDLTLGSRVETMELGTLAAGQKKEIEFPLVADQAGVIQIRAAASGEAGLRSEASSQVVVRRAALQVEVAAPRLKYAGSQAAFQVVVRNTGDADAVDVAASLLLPMGAEYLSGLQGAKLAEGQLVWTVGNVPVGAQREYTMVCTLHRAGENRVEAVVTDATRLTASHAAITEVQALADLKLLVNDPKGPIPVGEQVVYEVEVVNRGTKAAENVKVIGQFSAGIDPVQVDGGRGQISDDGQVMFEPIARIEPGKTVKLVIMAKASLDGNHRFRAQVTCKNPETDLVAEDTTRFFRDSAVRSTAREPATLAPEAQPTPAPRKIDVRR